MKYHEYVKAAKNSYPEVLQRIWKDWITSRGEDPSQYRNEIQIFPSGEGCDVKLEKFVFTDDGDWIMGVDRRGWMSVRTHSVWLRVEDLPDVPEDDDEDG